MQFSGQNYEQAVVSFIHILHIKIFVIFFIDTKLCSLLEDVVYSMITSFEEIGSRKVISNLLESTTIYNNTL